MSQPLVPKIVLFRLQSPEDKDIQRAKTFIKSEMDRIRQVLKDKAAPKTAQTPVEAPVPEVPTPVEPLEDIVLRAPELLNNLLVMDEYVQNIYIQALRQRESI